MAFSGYLIKLMGGTAETLPLKYVALESYSCTPDQRMESKASRATTGLLHRTTVEHKPMKIEFETPAMMTNVDVATLNAMIQSHFTDSLQRKLTIEFYNNETDSYREAECYMPDVQYKIIRVDKGKNLLYYDKIRYAFIEY